MAKKLYEITCEGQYWTMKKGEIKHYTFTWFGDENVKESGFLSAFRGALRPINGEDSAILKKLKIQYPDYKRFRTHVVSDVRDMTNAGKPVYELGLMNRTQLIRYIDKKGLPIDPDLYPSVVELRQALKDYSENPNIFERFQEKRRKTRGPRFAVMNSIEELNKMDTPKPTNEAVFTAPVVSPDEPTITELDEKNELEALLHGV